MEVADTNLCSALSDEIFVPIAQLDRIQTTGRVEFSNTEHLATMKLSEWMQVCKMLDPSR